MMASSGNEVSELGTAGRGRRGRLLGVVAIGLVLAAAVALSTATVATAEERGLMLPSGRVIPPLETEGPFGSTVGIELYDRLRGEFVEWFATPSNASNSNYRYDFLGNKFQVGMRVKLDDYEVFVQYQDTT